MPFFAYRGPILRADRDGARAILFAGRRVVVDVSLGASVPTKSKDDEARSGMPDLAGTFEIGPNLVVELWQASNRKLKVELRMPVREAITLERSPRAIGLTFSPNLNLDISGLPGKGNLGLLAGPLFARPALPPVLLRRRPGVRDREPARLRGPGRLRRLARHHGLLAPLRQRLARRVRSLRRSARRGICPEPARAQGNHRHCGLRHLMDLRDFEPARTDRRLSGEAAQAPALRHRVFFACVIVQLGAMSLVWACSRRCSRCCCRARIAGRLGRPAVSFIYRCCWASAERLGLMRDRFERARRPARRARRPDRRRQPSDHARCAARRRPAAARRVRHEGRADAQHLPRRRRAPGALHQERRRPRHGARRRADPARRQPAGALPGRNAHGRRADQRLQARASR